MGRAASEQAMRAFRGDGRGPLVDLGGLGGADVGSDAAAINASGQVAGVATVGNWSGYHAFVSNPDGPMVDLGTFGGSFSVASALNDSGLVVGYAATAGDRGSHAFVANASGMLTDLGTLGGIFSAASGINAAGQIVGASQNARGDYVPFLYENGRMIDLSTLVRGFIDLSPEAYINDRGQIAGTGTIEGQRHAFLLSDLDDVYAVPEPTSSTLVVAGLLAHVLRRRNRNRQRAS